MVRSWNLLSLWNVGKLDRKRGRERKEKKGKRDFGLKKILNFGFLLKLGRIREKERRVVRGRERRWKKRRGNFGNLD